MDTPTAKNLYSLAAYSSMVSTLQIHWSCKLYTRDGNGAPIPTRDFILGDGNGKFFIFARGLIDKKRSPSSEVGLGTFHSSMSSIPIKVLVMNPQMARPNKPNLKPNYEL